MANRIPSDSSRSLENNESTWRFRLNDANRLNPLTKEIMMPSNRDRNSQKQGGDMKIGVALAAAANHPGTDVRRYPSHNPFKGSTVAIAGRVASGLLLPMK
jgi:hypothetical protein